MPTELSFGKPNNVAAKILVEMYTTKMARIGHVDQHNERKHYPCRM